MAIPSRSRSSRGPRPDSSRSRGVWIAPAQRITSPDARTERSRPSTKNSRPVHRLPVNTSLTTRASVRTVRFAFSIAGRR
jgi:hypothetical protein